MTELIIVEKPMAALKIATALANTKPIQKTEKTISYYELTHKKNKIIIVSAVGHLFSLAEKEKIKSYPNFNVEWCASYKINKFSAYTKKYLDVIKKLSKLTNKITVATDYDIEGSLIGANCVRFICNKEDARRMKFSTLTKDELVKSYENASPHLDFERIEAGEARHILDFYYGVNTSKALTNSIKNATGYFKLMSTGRVQGPTLKVIVELEKKIKEFIPEDYWEIYLDGEHGKNKIKAQYEKGKLKKEEDAKGILKKTKDKKAIVSKVTKKPFNQLPPTPFDLTTLQIEAFRTLRISPKETSSLAQELYISGLISYPRTSSQKLPKTISYEKILKLLSKQTSYSDLCKRLLKITLKPTEGKKSDPAHPAIYPTGETAKILGKKQQLYDLIVRRFLSCFAPTAKRQTTTIKIDVNEEIFVLSGTITLEKGWHEFYGRYVNLKEQEIPKIEEKDEIKIIKIYSEKKQTQPPKRFNQASIIKEMEKIGIGTKATRANIVDALYQRNYVQDQPIKATDLGIKLIETLEKYSPEIIDTKLTKHFEKEMEFIIAKKTKKEKVIEESKKVLTKILKNFKKNEIEIGKELKEASFEAQKKANEIGICPKCKKRTLSMRRGKFGQFIACNKYPDCKTIFSIPQNLIKPTKEICESCGLPKILIIKKRKASQILCINPQCSLKLKDYTKEKLKEMEDIESGKVVKKCPKCGKGKLKVRRSVYGSFIACDQYPKCRYTEKFEEEKTSKVKKKSK